MKEIVFLKPLAEWARLLHVMLSPTGTDVFVGNVSAHKQRCSEVCCKRREGEKSCGHVFVGSTCAGTGPDPPQSAAR